MPHAPLQQKILSLLHDYGAEMTITQIREATGCTSHVLTRAIGKIRHKGQIEARWDRCSPRRVHYYRIARATHD